MSSILAAEDFYALGQSVEKIANIEKIQFLATFKGFMENISHTLFTLQLKRTVRTNLDFLEVIWLAIH